MVGILGQHLSEERLGERQLHGQHQWQRWKLATRARISKLFLYMAM